MKRQVLLLVAVVALYLVISLALQAIYGPSFGFLAGEDHWRSDGQGGWVKHGEPSDPAPAEPSVEIPLVVRYLPVFIPGLLLILFLFTPLRFVLEPRRGEGAARADLGESTDSEAPEENERPD